MEGSDKLIGRAKEALQWAGQRIGRFACARMQDFAPEPGRYDLIWIQWCIGSLTDADLEARAPLEPARRPLARRLGARSPAHASRDARRPS